MLEEFFSSLSVLGWVLLGIVAVAVMLFRSVRTLRQSLSRQMPRSFDFDAYKSREINVRGVFDKTKWF